MADSKWSGHSGILAEDKYYAYQTESSQRRHSTHVIQYHDDRTLDEDQIILRCKQNFSPFMWISRRASRKLYSPVEEELSQSVELSEPLVGVRRSRVAPHTNFPQGLSLIGIRETARDLLLFSWHMQINQHLDLRTIIRELLLTVVMARYPVKHELPDKGVVRNGIAFGNASEPGDIVIADEKHIGTGIRKLSHHGRHGNTEILHSGAPRDLKSVLETVEESRELVEE